jgi:anti-sigma B factor antagonist
VRQWHEFDLRAWDEAGVRVVRVTGEFDIAGCERFRKSVDRVDAEMVVVDLRGATFLDSSAVRELIDLHRLAGLRGSRLAILRPDGQADLIFRLTGMDGYLPLYDQKVPVLAEFNFG